MPIHNTVLNGELKKMVKNVILPFRKIIFLCIDHSFPGRAEATVRGLRSRHQVLVRGDRGGSHLRQAQPSRPQGGEGAAGRLLQYIKQGVADLEPFGANT